MQNSSLVGRRAWVQYPHRTFPNFYTLLLGRTGGARKSTAARFALDLAAEAAEKCGAKLKTLHGLASVEGLAAAMLDGDAEPFRIIVIEDEFRSLITKSHQKGVANLIPRITELYNCGPRFEVNTRGERIAVKEPFVAILSNSTEAWFTESLDESAVSGGFLNRWCLFSGQSDKEIPFPIPPSEVALSELAGEVARVASQAEGAYNLSPQARESFKEFYRAFKRRQLTDAAYEATERGDLHAMKFALVYAVLAGRRSQIEMEDIGRGIALSGYCMKVVARLAGGIGVSRMGAKEHRILEILKKGRMSTRELLRRLKLTAGELTMVTRSLQQVGLVRLVPESTIAGHERIFVELQG